MNDIKEWHLLLVAFIFGCLLAKFVIRDGFNVDGFNVGGDNVEAEIKQKCQGDSILNDFFYFGCDMNWWVWKWLFLIGFIIVCIYLYPIFMHMRGKKVCKY